MNKIFMYIKKHIKIVLAVVVVSISLLAFNIFKTPQDNPEKDKLLLELLQFVVSNYHYEQKDINDDFSKAVYKDYIKSLDSEKKFFLQSDINEFSKYELQIDDAIKNKDLTFFDLTYNRLQQRIRESRIYYAEILEKPFEYFTDETIEMDADKNQYATTTVQLKDNWRKIIKLSTLASLTEKMKMEDDKKNGVTPTSDAQSTLDPSSKEAAAIAKAKEKLKESKTEADYKPKSFVQLEIETRESSKKNYDEYFSYMKDLEREDYFTMFINSIAEQFDPHTSYFAADDKEKFDVSMSGKFFGIGARLQKKGDYTEISELISGGPAWRERELEKGDIIMKVGQGIKEPEDIIGMKINDVVKRIKGPKGTEVRLTVKKITDGSTKVIKITRDEVELEETYAKSTIVKKDGKIFGIINLPKFYIDFENKDNRDAAKDVAIEVERLKLQGVEGIAIDLRDNGGGSLRTVVDIAGLFIKDGPIVQVKTVGRKQEVLSDQDSKIQWDGPLVLMINNFSASASEILAAAMQDYKRGIVIGSTQSYGKGTVQNVIDLNQMVRNSAVGDLGAMKTTTQKFYRIDGGSTQLKGVSSDVAMPDRYSYIEVGERDAKNAMPWDKIEPAQYSPINNISNYNSAIANSKLRISQNPQFKMIDENAKILSKRKDETVYSLNINKFKAEEEELNAEIKRFKPISEYTNKLTFISLPEEVKQFSQDTILKKKRDRWHEQLAKDAYVEEALNVLGDLSPKSVAKTKLPYKNKKGKLVGQL